jgi:hypothetical protein
MKHLFAATLLVAAFAVTGCGDAKKPAAKPATPATQPAPGTTDKPAETPKTP